MEKVCTYCTTVDVPVDVLREVWAVGMPLLLALILHNLSPWVSVLYLVAALAPATGAGSSNFIPSTRCIIPDTLSSTRLFTLPQEAVLGLPIIEYIPYSWTGFPFTGCNGSFSSERRYTSFLSIMTLLVKIHSVILRAIQRKLIIHTHFSSHCCWCPITEPGLHILIQAIVSWAVKW